MVSIQASKGQTASTPRCMQPLVQAAEQQDTIPVLQQSTVNIQILLVQQLWTHPHRNAEPITPSTASTVSCSRLTSRLLLSVARLQSREDVGARDHADDLSLGVHHGDAVHLVLQHQRGSVCRQGDTWQVRSSAAGYKHRLAGRGARGARGSQRAQNQLLVGRQALLCFCCSSCRAATGEQSAS